MKELLKKTGNLIKTVYGYSIVICLFAGGLTFFGYLAAFILGGNAAQAICEFIYKSVLPVIIYATSITVVLGLVSMYLCGEIALSVKDTKKK